MDDITYILKICIQAVNVLLACEIGLYLLANRKGQSKGLKKSPFQPPITLKIYWGFFLFFLFSATAFIFNGLATRSEYFFNTLGGIVNSSYPIFENIKEFSFLYANLSIFLAIFPSLTKKRFRIPLIISFLIIFVFLTIMIATSQLVFYDLIDVIIPFCIVLLFIFRVFVQLSQGRIQKQFLSILIGYMIYCASYVLTSHLVNTGFNFQNNIISEPFMLVGLIVMGTGFITLPSINEAFSTAFIEQIFLATKEGKIILRHNFKTFLESSSTSTNPTPEDIDDTTFTSSIVGIEGLLREISATKGRVKAIDEGGKIFLIDRIASATDKESNIFAILVTYLDLHILRSQLLNLVYDVETNFLGEILTNKELPDETRVKIVGLIKNRFIRPSKVKRHSLCSDFLAAATPQPIED